MISVRNLQRAIKINAAELAISAQKALRLCLEIQKNTSTALTKLREISVLLVSDQRMVALHRAFMGKNARTDVLTFQHGEIVISVETARDNARRFGNPLRQEIVLCIVHGLLHLHGFGDQTKAEARRMRAAESRILRAL